MIIPMLCVTIFVLLFVFFSYTTLFRSRECERGPCFSSLRRCSRLPETRNQASPSRAAAEDDCIRSEEHTSELQSLRHLVCRLLLEKKKILVVWLLLSMDVRLMIHTPTA